MQISLQLPKNGYVDTSMHPIIYLTVLIPLHAFRLLQLRFLRLKPPSLIIITTCHHHRHRHHQHQHQHQRCYHHYQIVTKTHKLSLLFTLTLRSRWRQVNYTKTITVINLQKVMSTNFIIINHITSTNTLITIKIRVDVI